MTITEPDRRCFACGARWEPGDRFCAECGSPLAGAQLAAALDARDGGAPELAPVPPTSPRSESIPLPEDVAAPLLGPDVLDRLDRAGVDPRAVWTWELALRTRAINGLVAVDAFVLADIVDVSVGRLLLIRGVGETTLTELRTKTALSNDDIRELAARVQARRGTAEDPSAHVFGADFVPTLASLGTDPRQIALRTLRLRSLYLNVLESHRLTTLDDVAGLTNLELLRRLRSPRSDVLHALWSAGRSWLDAKIAVAGPAAQPAPAMAQPSVPPKGERAADDLVETAFERLVSAVASLPERSRKVLARRLGLDGFQRQTLEEVGQSFGVTRARAHQIEANAVRMLTHGRGTFASAHNGVERLRQELALSWRDEALAAAFAKRYPRLARVTLGHLRLLAAVFPAQTPEHGGLDGVDEAAMTVVARSGPLPLPDLARKVSALLEPAELARFPSFSIAQRLELIGPLTRRDDGRYDRPEGAVPGAEPKRERRLAAMVGIIKRLGPSHFSTIARELDVHLPPEYRLSDRDVHAWLGRYDEVFVWAGPGRFGLASQDVGIRAGAEAEGGIRSRRRGIGDEIQVLLRERGPLPMAAITDHVLSRLQVKPGSVVAAVYQDPTRRFRFTEDRRVELSPAEERRDA